GRRRRARRRERRPRARFGSGAAVRGRLRARDRPRAPPDPCRARLQYRRVTSVSLQLDVFTLVPHAFGWLTEQRPLAYVLGRGLDLRLFNYRETTPLRAGQVDDEPYGGGPGMVLRVDVVAAALDAVYGGVPPHRVVALTPQGRQLDQATVEELATEQRITLLSARFGGLAART